MAISGDFLEHLSTGHTLVCNVWTVRRKDGAVFGFTDHDNDLEIDGIIYRAGSGLTANSVQQSTGLSVDNTEATGILTSESVTEGDLRAGRFDGAEIEAWMVNWTDVSQRSLRFRGRIGEVTTQAGTFTAELRGQTEALNSAKARVYQRDCTARLGDQKCGIDLGQPAFSVEAVVASVLNGQVLEVIPEGEHADRWFERGSVTVLNGAAAGLSGQIKADRLRGNGRRVDLWESFGATVDPGDRVRLTAGCDKRAETCRAEFGNFANFRGCPHIPGEDWLLAYPRKGAGNTGGSLYQ